MSQAPRRMRSTHVAIGVTAVVAAALSGCSSSPDYGAVCTDPVTNERVDDDLCDDDDGYRSSGSSGFFWYYLGSSSRYPSVGSPVSGGSRSVPSGSVQRGGLSSSGGDSVSSSTTRSGGFGGSGTTSS